MCSIDISSLFSSCSVLRTISATFLGIPIPVPADITALLVADIILDRSNSTLRPSLLITIICARPLFNSSSIRCFFIISYKYFDIYTISQYFQKKINR